MWGYDSELIELKATENHTSSIAASLQVGVGVLLELQLTSSYRDQFPWNFPGVGSFGGWTLWHHILAELPPLPKRHLGKDLEI